MRSNHHRVYCHGCATHFIVPTDIVFRCRDCNTPVRFEHDTRGNVIRAYDRRDRIVYMAAAANTLELWHDQPENTRRRGVPGRSPLAVLDTVRTTAGPFGALV